MGSSCSRVRRLGSSNNTSSSRPLPQVCENSDSSDVEDGSLQSPLTSSNIQFVVSESDQSIDGPVLTNSVHSMNPIHSIHDLETLSTDRTGLNSETDDILQSNTDLVSRSLGSGSQGMQEDENLESGLHIDMVSISSNNNLPSNIREDETRELRSRGRRSFWDVFSRQNLTRHSDIPAIMFAIDDADELGVNGRLLLDINSDHHNDIVSHDWGSRSSNRMGHRHSRFERSESVNRGTVVEDLRRRLCASGLHQHGTCSCDSQFPGDEFGALVRISRIVILVEAINELIDEIHRQTTPLSISTLSLPASESIVNSLLLKNHKKLDNMTESSEDAQQCYICLAEYEEGDKIRVLPCKHEYHMPCVDKWLKEVHGICPLCRADVSGSSHPQSTHTES